MIHWNTPFKNVYKYNFRIELPQQINNLKRKSLNLDLEKPCFCKILIQRGFRENLNSKLK